MSGTTTGSETHADPPEPLASIRNAMKSHDRRARELQRHRLRFGLAAIALSPFAVLMLAIQVAYCPGSGLCAEVLIFLEALILAVALLISFWQMGGSHRSWIRERLRAELLRREEFLFRARIGPFLVTSPTILRSRVKERLLLFDSDIRDPIELVPMKENGDESWRDALENARAANSLTTVPDLRASIETYLAERVEEQREWFASKSRTHGSRAWWLENAAKLCLTVALLVAVWHLHLLLRVPANAESFQDKFIIVLALSLPALGAMFVGIQSLMESDRLSRSYSDHARLLEDFEALLQRLGAQLAQASASEREKLQFQFMRTVLAVEEMLSSELHQWWLVMYPRTPKASH